MKENTTNNLGYKAAQDLDELTEMLLKKAANQYISDAFLDDVIIPARDSARSAAMDVKKGAEKIARMVTQVLCTEDYDLAADLLEDADKTLDEINMATSGAHDDAEEADDAFRTAAQLWKRHQMLTTGQPDGQTNEYLDKAERETEEARESAVTASYYYDAAETLVSLLREMAARA